MATPGGTPPVTTPVTPSTDPQVADGANTLLADGVDVQALVAAFAL